MDTQTRERLIGALVLVVIVVLLVPALLTGRGRRAAPEPVPEETGVEIVLERNTEGVDLEPAPDPAALAAPLDAAPAPASTPAAGGSDGDLPVEPPAATVAPEPALPPPSPPPATAAPAPEVPVVAAPTGFAVQLGAFRTRSRADQWVGELRGLGYAAFVFEYRADGQVLYRVRVGPERERARAELLADRLSKAGHDGVVVPHP